MSLANQGLPHLIHGLDVRSLPLRPEEAFVLSRVDGSSDPSEIAAATGLSEEQVTRCLQRLNELGAIRFEAGAPVEGNQSSTLRPTPRRAISSMRIRPPVERAPETVESPPESPAYDPSLLDEPADLNPERKRLVLDHYFALDELTHYAILQVSEGASKSEIRAAYYQRVGLFHPDRYFGKNLGSFKPKLEKVFGALTKAYDTLTRKRSREEYDRYLAVRRRTAGLSDSCTPDRLPPITPAPARSPVSETRAADPVQTSPRSPPPRPAAPSVPPPDPDAQRQALARKLRSRGSIPPPPNPPSPDPAARAQVASEDLKARYARHRGAPETRVERYRKLAAAALEDGHFVSAVNALKVALSLAPDDATLLALLDQTQTAADVAHADQFLERARYEEKDGRLTQAARSYERAARGKNSASLYDRAAQCLISANLDARKAVDLARKATDLESDRGMYHLTLARAYHLGGMPTSAQRELQRAAELAPDNEEIKTWLKRLK